MNTIPHTVHLSNDFFYQKDNFVFIACIHGEQIIPKTQEYLK